MAVRHRDFYTMKVVYTDVFKVLELKNITKNCASPVYLNNYVYMG